MESFRFQGGQQPFLNIVRRLNEEERAEMLDTYESLDVAVQASVNQVLAHFRQTVPSSKNIEELKRLQRISEEGRKIAAKVASVAYESLLPASFILLGMGNDGHTASWFPDARNLADAFAPAADNVVAIDATGCPVAGEFVSRLTISNAALKGTRSAALLLHGADKKETLRRAMTEDVLQAHIRAAMATLGDRLKIAWAP